jgi:fucose permease
LIALGLAALNSGHELISVTSTAVFGCGLGLVLPGFNLWVAEVAQTRRSSALSILNFAWGIGAISCPVLIMFAQRNDQLNIFFFCIAGLAALFALGFMTIDIEPRSGFNSTVAPPRDAPPVKLRTAVTLACLFFLYCGTESAVGGWAAALTKRMGTSQGDFWELAPMCFWTGLLTGRALGPLVLPRVPERKVLNLGLILVCICIGAVLWVATLQGAAISLVAAGLGLACIYPLLVSSLVGIYGKRASRTGSIIFAFAGLGAATLPWLVGFISTRFGGLRVGLLVPLVACLVMLCLLSYLYRQNIPAPLET